MDCRLGTIDKKNEQTTAEFAENCAEEYVESGALFSIASTFTEQQDHEEENCQHVLSLSEDEAEIQQGDDDNEGVYSVYGNLDKRAQATERLSPSNYDDIHPRQLALQRYVKAIMSETGVAVNGCIRETKNGRKKNWRLQAYYGLVSFIAEMDEGAMVAEPVFTLRASLVPPGATHSQCIYPTLYGCRVNDPCIRLGLQYRLLTDASIQAAGEGWKWAAIRDMGPRRNASFEERIGKAKTFVDLLESRDIPNISKSKRRSLRRWGYRANKKARLRKSGNPRWRKKENRERSQTDVKPGVCYRNRIESEDRIRG